MRAVTTPVATPRAKEPLKTPMNIPKDFSSAMTSNVWLLSPCGWYATIDLIKRTVRESKSYQPLTKLTSQLIKLK